jgi:uncharacterized protein YcbK (DUF882 family)
MRASTKTTNRERLRPLLSTCALALFASIALSGCVSSKTGDPVAELLTPDADAVESAGKKAPLTEEERLAQAASPSPEYQASAAASPETAANPASADPNATATANLPGAVMQATGINASRSSIFSTAPPAQAPLPAESAPNAAAYSQKAEPAAAAPAGIHATNASVFSASGKNPLLATGDDSAEGSDESAELEADDVPLILRGKLYSSRDLGPDPSEAPASDMVTLAALPSLTRQAVTGLLVQRPDVEISCFKPRLVNLLKGAEQHFGKRIVVTSGYRSLAHNTAVGGAKRSQHLHCDAADIQMIGVSKWDLARYFRSQPTAGGVGTYCSTASIHVDIGRRRDWNWKCRRDTEL